MSSALLLLSDDEGDGVSLLQLSLVVPPSRHPQTLHMSLHRAQNVPTPSLPSAPSTPRHRARNVPSSSLPSAPSTPRGHRDRRRPRHNQSDVSGNTSGFVTPRSAPSPPPSEYANVNSPAVDNLVAQLAALEVRPLDDVPYVPLYLRDAGDRRMRFNWRVPDDIRAMYPPTKSFRTHLRWYVLVRSYETGIVYDTWANVFPITVFPGGYSPGFDRYDDAAALWRDCETQGSICRVVREE